MEIKNRVNTLIYWENYGSGSFTYGTTLKFNKKDKTVYYSNRMAHTGTIIKSWESKTNFQGNRKVPQLPILESGVKYKVKLEADVEPARSMYVKIIFFNIYGEEIDYIFIKNNFGEIIYPDKAYSYKVELFNAGVHSAVFKYLQIASMDEEIDEVIVTKIKNKNEENKELNVLFVDYSLNSINYISEEILNKFDNLILVNGVYSKICYNNTNVKEKLLATINAASNEKVNFIGYTTISNIAAICYSKLIDNSRVTIFNNIEQFDKYIRMANKSDIDHRAILATIEKLIFENKIKLYGEDDIYSFDKKLVNSIMDYSYRLNFLDI